jgi:hypothetical protein
MRRHTLRTPTVSGRLADERGDPQLPSSLNVHPYEFPDESLDDASLPPVLPHSFPRPNNNFLEDFTGFCEVGSGAGETVSWGGERRLQALEGTMGGSRPLPPPLLIEFAGKADRAPRLTRAAG